MLLASTQSLEDFIVRSLGKNRAATVAELRAAVAKEFQDYSLPAFYKELRKLQEQGVVIRKRNELSLSLSWVLNFISLADTFYDSYVTSPGLGDILPGEGGVSTFYFKTLSMVDDFWIHVMLMMAQESNSKRLFQWVPHPWYYLVNSHKSFPLHNALRTAGARVDNIVGGNTFLDRYGQRITTEGIYELHYAPGPFEGIRDKYYCVSDKYLLTVHLSSQKAAEVDSYYESIKSLDEVEVSAVIALTTRNARTKVTIEQKPRAVKEIWNKFVNYFEVATELKL